MADRDFTELISYLDEKFTKVDGRFAIMEKRFDELQTAVDAYANRADTYFQEMVMLAHKVDKHEKWLQQIADKLGIKLEH